MSMSSDTKAIIGTGIGLATLLLMLIGMMFRQNANVNARIDDVQADIRDLRADVQSDIRGLRADVQADIRDLRADVQSDIRDLRADVQSDMNVLHGGLRELRADVREIRGLLVDHLDEHPAADH